MQNLQPTQDFTQFDLSKMLIQSGFYSKVKLQPTTRLILGVLVSHLPNIRPAIETIANEAGCNARTVEKCLCELKQKGLILITYTGRANNYKLTPYFFSMILPPEQTRQSIPSDLPDCHPNKQQNKKTNKGFKIFFKTDQTKLPKYHHNTHITGMNYPKWKPTEQKKESPLDLDETNAREFLEKLPLNMQNSFFAVQLRKKWNIQQTHKSSNP